jgi:hypothetical protein
MPKITLMMEVQNLDEGKYKLEILGNTYIQFMKVHGTSQFYVKI